MKRIHPGFLARAPFVDVRCDEIVRCTVVLEAPKWPSRLGRAAQRRRAAGGPRAVGRPSVCVEEWRRLRERLRARSGGACEVPTVRSLGALALAIDPHHAIPCSAGGADTMANLLDLCRSCHRWIDADVASRTGRLHTIPTGQHLGLYGFAFWLETPDKIAEIGRLTFYVMNDEPASLDVTGNFWKLFAPAAPVPKALR